ncbi:MAG TPA: sugar phosphate isomerase/epimerase [Caldilineae bacterium]|nr:sugar phosphate isomerase/epimerase [Caldilineae bacterium]
MKFSQSSFVYFNYPLPEAIRRLHRYGYQGVEIWGGRPHAYRRDLDDQIDEIIALLDRLEMGVPNFVPAQFRYPSILCSLNEAVRRDSVQYIKDEIDTALRLGAPSVSLCPGMTLYGEDVDKGWAQLRKSIMELLDYTEGTDLLLLIEPAHRAESTLILTVDDGLRMVEEIGSERLGILLDTGHAHVNGEDLAEAVRKLAGVPLHIHIDDNHGDSDAHLIPGEGSIDFKPFVQALGEIDYQGFLSAELGFQYTMDPDAAVEETYAVLSQLFAPDQG